MFYRLEENIQVANGSQNKTILLFHRVEEVVPKMSIQYEWFTKM
jgi:hypothetical protein